MKIKERHGGIISMVSDSKCSYTNSDDEMKPPGKLDLNSTSGVNTPGEVKGSEMGL